MALNYNEIKKLKKIIDESYQHSSNRLNILSLGYPDILATKEQLATLFQGSVIESLETRDDAIDVAAMHNMEGLVHWCVESYALFRAMNVNFEVIDFTDWTGSEIVFDLNQPIYKEWHEKYDLVIDPGTTEHVFNIAQVMINILLITKKDGYIYHQTPFSLPNHGFYSISPTFYIDFYEENDAVLESYKILSLAEDEKDLNIREPFSHTHGTSSILVKKVKHKEEIAFPIQGKYKNSFTDDEAIERIKDKFRKYDKIAVIPYNAHAKKLASLLKEQTVTFFDDNKILKKYLSIEPLNSITDNEFDAVVITSLTFEKRIKKYLIDLGINENKIYLQV